MKKKVNKIVLYSSFVFACFLFSCIVYASISSVNMEVDGVAKAEAQDGMMLYIIQEIMLMKQIHLSKVFIRQ